MLRDCYHAEPIWLAFGATNFNSFPFLIGTTLLLSRDQTNTEVQNNTQEESLNLRRIIPIGKTGTKIKS